MKPPFAWDYNSDQPYQLKDKNYKKRMRNKERLSFVKMGFYSLLSLPFSLLFMPFTPKRTIDSSKFFGMSVTMGKDVDEQVALIKELGITNILVRIPLWDAHYIKSYVTFIEKFSDCSITVNLMQDREHIQDKNLLAYAFNVIFKHLQYKVDYYQVGTTINRAKWGFFSVDEYLDFYEVAQEVAYPYPNVKLLGPSVIDFEYHYSAYGLFNFRNLRYDGTSALLYVDRRGAPEFKQMGFSLLAKIKLLASMMNLSQKTSQKLFITETNWPLSNTAPYAPTSEKECVSEEEYANFMLRYYLIALGSKQVDVIFWHQLIANGYGLIDARDGLRKRPAFNQLKMLVHLFSDVTVISFKRGKNYTLTCKDNHTHAIITALWSPKHSSIIKRKEDGRYFTASNEELLTPLIPISQEVVYCVQNR